MRIGIDCDGVLRDFIPALIDSIKETHPEHSDKIKNIMEEAVSLEVPNKVDYEHGKNWGEIK